MRLVIGAVFAGCSFLLAADGFSHEFHLKLVQKCTDCHAGAPASKLVSDNLRPAKEACATCHEDGAVRVERFKAGRQPAISKFDHSIHTKLGSIAPVIKTAIEKKTYLSVPAEAMVGLLEGAKQDCEGCHRGLRVSDAQPAADHLPKMADCLVCHSQIDPPDSCAKCHSGGGVQLKPANHTADFHSSHSGGKLGLDLKTCAVCHGRRFTCQGCH